MGRRPTRLCDRRPPESSGGLRISRGTAVVVGPGGRAGDEVDGRHGCLLARGLRPALNQRRARAARWPASGGSARQAQNHAARGRRSGRCRGVPIWGRLGAATLQLGPVGADAVTGRSEALDAHLRVSGDPAGDGLEGDLGGRPRTACGAATPVRRRRCPWGLAHGASGRSGTCDPGRSHAGTAGISGAVRIPVRSRVTT